MTSDVRRPLTEAGRDHINAARRVGGLCAGCGRGLAPDEPVWWTLFRLSGVYGRRSQRWAPVGRECAPPGVLRAADTEGPERCQGCGRGVYDGPTSHMRTLVYCSKRCSSRYRATRAREARQ